MNRATDRALPDPPADGAGDEVLELLEQASASHLEHVRTLVAELDRAREEAQAAKAASERERARAERLQAAFCDIHRALFSSNLYDLILRACLSITRAERGLYVTWRSDRDRPRVRGSVRVDGYPEQPLSDYVMALCQRARDEGETLVRNQGEELEGLPQPREGERFRNLIVAPVTLLKDLDGIVLAADKEDGDFEQEDVESLITVGNQASIVLENRQLERQLQSAYVSTLSMLADAVEAKDPYTHGHCEMASRYARLIAERMNLSEHDRSLVCYAALLHDVGKIGVSDGVLHKPGPLLPEEMALMRAHVRVGHDLLSTIPALQRIADVVLHHHEWYDGTGYPDGQKGDTIPTAARIVGVVDAYCAMITKRAYKEAYTPEHARSELARFAGRQFDPRIVEIFLSILESGEGGDRDDDFDAECGLLPQLLPLVEAGERGRGR